LLDFTFIGLTYIVVYVGAIAILFLFVIMMVQIQNVALRANIQLPLDKDYLINSSTTLFETNGPFSGHLLVTPKGVDGGVGGRMAHLLRGVNTIKAFSIARPDLEWAAVHPLREDGAPSL
jgi:hypothetical protein